MKQLFIAGNWKSNKTITEAREWFDQFKTLVTGEWKLSEHSNCHTVLCVPFTAMSALHDDVVSSGLPIELGGQNVSPYTDGAYTGEISSRMLKELASWVVIGHSERRKYFSETTEILTEKITQAKAQGLKVIYCVQNDQTFVPDGVDVVAYEPFWAIGTGKTDTPENANSVVVSIKKKTNVARVIYGGSVTGDNVKDFVRQNDIDGVLPGGASLTPEKFYSLLVNASSA